MFPYRTCLISGLLCAGAVQGFAAQDRENLNHRWFLTGDYLLYNRSGSGSVALINDGDTTVVSSKGLVHSFPPKSGYRLAVAYRDHDQMTAEVNGFYIVPMAGQRSASNPGMLSFPFDLTGYTVDYYQADQATARNRSSFWGLEGNYWYHVSPRNLNYFSLSGLFGLRYFNLGERFVLSFIKGAQESDYRINSRNNVFGAQLGGNLQINPTPSISWDMTLKLGGYLNNASQSTLLRDDANEVTLRDFNPDTWVWGGLLDFAAGFTFLIKERFNVHFGYQLLILSNIALAPEQVSEGTRAISGNSVNANGDPLWQGLYAGLTVEF